MWLIDRQFLSEQNSRVPENHSSQNLTGHIGALDGWRGIAILLVLVDHAGDLSHSRAVHAATRLGATGVGLFFALSGFLITSLLLREYAKTGTISFRSFYTRRIFRIIPPVLAYLAVLVFLHSRGLLHVTRSQIVSTLLLYRNYLVTDLHTGWYTGHMWSLMVEEHFYLLWPCLLFFTRRRLWPPVVLALSIADWRILSGHLHTFRGVWPPGRTDLRMDALLWGCILAVILFRPEWKARLTARFTLPVLIVLLAVDAVSNVVHGQHDYSWFEPIILALLLVWPILRERGFLRSILDAKPLTAIGRISYSLYIWQELWFLDQGAPALFPHLQRFPINIVMAFVCAILSYYLVEQPFILMGKWLIRWFRPNAHQLPAVTLN